MTKRGTAISAASYKHERRVLIAVLDYAVRDGMLLDNPARTSVPIRKIPKSKPIIPTREQFVKLVETIRHADLRAQPAGDLVELLGYSGMRLGEAVNASPRTRSSASSLYSRPCVNWSNAFAEQTHLRNQIGHSHRQHEKRHRHRLQEGCAPIFYAPRPSTLFLQQCHRGQH